MTEPLATKAIDVTGISGGKGPVPQPCHLVIFGVAGDLSWRKLLPAVYNLNIDSFLPSHFSVVGFGLPASGEIPADPDAYIRDRARDGIQKFSRRPLDEEHFADFARALFFVPGSFNDTGAYKTLKAKLDALDQQFGVPPGARVYYLAVPPGVVPDCVTHLKAAGMISRPEEVNAFTRVIVEKPIGHDLASARETMSVVAQAFHETQTYRIDHFLGKETVQNLMVLRFANSIFEPLWNANHIDHVQITVAEEEGLAQYGPGGEMLATRAGYYEQIGALRDMVQNHILQVLCMVCMDAPWSLAPDMVRDAKSGVLRCLRRMSPAEVDKQVVRGQYIEGTINGQRVPGYRKEVREAFELMKKPLPPESVNSTTETYVAMKLWVDNWRWAGVPFYIRTGKRLPKRASEVAIQFKNVPNVLFNANPEIPLEPTLLALRVQPEEGLSMRIASKLPGARVKIFPVKMEFTYGTSFGDQATPEAYERLLLDVMAGDATLFMRRDAVEMAWEFCMPILDRWQSLRVRDLPEYQCGTWGPIEADRIINADGRAWRTP
jgi:glucose-6-phosphate 1-dehydrogenase